MSRTLIASAAAALALALALASCGGDDGSAGTTQSTTGAPDSPSQTVPPAARPGELPPAFVECMADRGYEITSPAEVHSAPQDVLQECFATLHG